MRRPHLLLFIALSPLVMLPGGCTKEGSGTENSTETTTNGDGDGDPTGDGDPGDGDPGDGDPGDGDPGCTPGALNCVCDENGMCVEGLACVMGMCTFDNSCTPGTEGCECNAGACDAGLECVNNVCEPMGFPPGPYPSCGWSGGFNGCGFSEENPAFPVMCPDDSVLMEGGPCPRYLNYEGCCDMNGNNWWCDMGATFFENCPGGDGDGDGDPTGDGDGDGDGDTGDGDGDTGDGDGDGSP